MGLNNSNYKAASGYQAETAAFADTIKTAGGSVSAFALAAIDEFVMRNKVTGAYALIKECHVPVGDYVASQQRLVKLHDWTFNGFDGSEYSEKRGYYIPDATPNKYIATGLIPDNEGLSSKNFTIAFATTQSAKPTDFGRVVGTATGDGEAPIISLKEGVFGIRNVFLNHAYGYSATVMVGVYGANTYRCFLNGTKQSEAPSVTTPLSDEINIFRSIRGNGMQYATGGYGFYLIAAELTDAQAFELSNSVESLMTKLRGVYQIDGYCFFGDSITAKTGAQGNPQGGWTDIVARALGYRQINNAQGSTRIFHNDSSGAISAFNRYQPILNKHITGLAMAYGTNDMAEDPSNNGDNTYLTNFFNGYSVIVQDLKSRNIECLLVGPPYRPDMTAAKQLAYRAAAAAIAKASDKRMKFADLYYAFLDTGNPGALLIDGLHPNLAGHALIADYVLRAKAGQLIRKPVLTFGNIAAGSTATLNVDVANAEAGMRVDVCAMGALNGGAVSAYVSADDTVAVNLANTSGAAVNYPAVKFSITVYLNY